MRRVLVAALLMLPGCGEPPAPAGWQGLGAALKTPTAVDAWLIGADRRKPPPHFDYTEHTPQTPLDGAQIRALTKILSDPSSLSDGVKPCEPMPGVKVRYTRPNAEPVWVFFCFECLELYVYEGRASRMAKDFTPSAQALGAVFKNVFPKDEGIQRLK